MTKLKSTKKVDRRKSDEQALVKEMKKDYRQSNCYVISAKFMSQWLYVMESNTSKDGIDFGALESIFEHQQRELVDSYLKDN